MELTIDNQAKGTRILVGESAKERRTCINAMIAIAEEFGFEEIMLPSVERAQIYIDKAGPEILGQMYAFPDKGGRELCLRPEGTATVQLLADKHWKNQEKKLWYVERCWRYERPQAGRYREFTQFGIEWINPKEDPTSTLVDMAKRMVDLCGKPYEVNEGVKRGLSYYIGTGFEIAIPCLGAQKQVVGAGPYQQGIGFAVGVDRLLLAKSINWESFKESDLIVMAAEGYRESEKISQTPQEDPLQSDAMLVLNEFIQNEPDFYDAAEKRAFLHGCREALRKMKS